jgi:ubiquinone/menaquinone biosynthesis C-methylase UbiE
MPDFFAANAHQYDTARSPLLSDAARDRLLRAAGLTSSARLLDVATGTGRVAIPFARAGLDVVGVDRPGEMLSVLRTKASDVQVVQVIADGACLPLEL